MRFALLKVSIAALAISTWVFWSSIFSTRPENSTSAVLDPLESLVRLPASLQSEIPGMVPGMGTGSATRANDPIAMDVVSIPCWEKSSTASLSTSARWVRLTGRACGSMAAGEEKTAPDSVSVRNATNGYVATVFATQASKLTTDYIPLQSGHNEILIRFDQGPGAAVESQLNFVRQ